MFTCIALSALIFLLMADMHEDDSYKCIFLKDQFRILIPITLY